MCVCDRVYALHRSSISVTIDTWLREDVKTRCRCWCVNSGYVLRKICGQNYAMCSWHRLAEDQDGVFMREVKKVT